MKNLLLAGAALAASGCMWDYSGRAAQIPVGPAVSAQPVSQVANAQPAAKPSAPVATAQPAAAATEPSSRTDYGVAANWLCRPGMASNPCEVNIDATVVKPDGSTSREAFVKAKNPAIDCFYVYPTVSLDPFTQSDLIPGPEEFNVVKAQLARFGAHCRIYAPMYRQFSLGALRSGRGAGPAVPQRGNRVDANFDIDDAWAHYLKHDNQGRGVVLIGHSQGSGQLIRLITSRIDGQPDQSRLVSAIIMGGTVQVPKGADVGGTFKSIPACRSASQVGCVISFSSFRDTVPPSDNAGFGINRGETEALCTNPAMLGGGKATTPKAYWSTADKEWLRGQKIDTPFVMTPGLTTTECVRNGKHTYLQVHFNADPADPRIDDPGTDVITNGKADPSWGLHLNDANIGMGDLVDVVGAQAAAWKKAHP